MKVIIDGRVLSHELNTGVQCYVREIIKAFDKINFKYSIAKPKIFNRYLHHLWEFTVLPYKARCHDILFCPANIVPLWLPKNVKLVLTLHSISFIKYRQAYKCSFKVYYDWLIPKALKRADRIITVSVSEKNNIIGVFPEYENKIDVVPNGINEIYLNRQRVDKKEKFILYVGSLSPGKNVKYLIKAFERISSYIPHTLIIAGNRMPIFKEMSLKGSNHKVSFRENMGEEELADLYSQSDLFVFPSFYESSGLPPLEAMSCGCPVIVSNISALRERCGDAAIYCNPNSIEDISGKILLVLQNSALKNQLSEKGIERAKLFRWDNSAKSMVKIFEGVYGT